MSTERRNHIATSFDPKASGRPCCYCGKPRPDGRRRWCSQDCVDDFKVRKGDANHIRFLLRKRDDEICQKCRFDTKPLQRVFYHLNWKALGWLQTHFDIGSRRTLWDADHIVPVVEGGGACGLDGYRTLCVWCHKEVTAELAARLAMMRRDANRPLLALMESQ